MTICHRSSTESTMDSGDDQRTSFLHSILSGSASSPFVRTSISSSAAVRHLLCAINLQYFSSFNLPSSSLRHRSSDYDKRLEIVSIEDATLHLLPLRSGFFLFHPFSFPRPPFFISSYLRSPHLFLQPLFLLPFSSLFAMSECSLLRAV